MADIKRVIAYIDGFNLYYGLRKAGFRKFYWLNPCKLVHNLIASNHLLVKVKYFTSRVSGSPTDLEKSKRQNTYLEAIGLVGNCQTYFGHYLTNTYYCRNCSAPWPIPKEKMTDVNIATEMIIDSFQNNYDIAMLISADGDLLSPIKAIKNIFHEKYLIVVFPPKRWSTQLKLIADAQLFINRSHLLNSQFPNKIIKPDGYELHRPELWR